MCPHTVLSVWRVLNHFHAAPRHALLPLKQEWTLCPVCYVDKYSFQSKTENKALKH